ncbi:UNVERIFIED_CONTAM: mrdA [Trichonephila clavipes]
MPQPIRLKDHERDARQVRRRVFVGGAVVLLLTLVLVARMYYLQVIQYEHHSTLAENNRIHVQPIPPTRAVTRERAGDWRQVLDVVVEVLELTPDDRALFEKRMLQGRRPFEPVPVLFELSEEQIARVAVNQFRLPGVEVVAQLVRHYPQGAHFAHSVGYVGRINEQELKQLDPINYSGTHHIGKTGIERFYEPLLHGQVGYEEVETNARGRVLRVLKRTDPLPGKDLTLTLDVKLQQAAEQALAGRRGAVVAIEPATGEVLAMVSQPSFDPNPFVTGIGFKAYAELRDSIDRPLYNRVLRGLYPPGSTIKPMVAVAGLDAGVVTPQSRVYDPGFYQLPGHTHKYRNWNRSGDGSVNLEYAIMRSNDTYFYDLAHKMGIDRMHDYMTRFGLGQRVSLDMFEETAGLMPSREWKRARYRQAWYPGETLILGIGQASAHRRLAAADPADAVCWQHVRAVFGQRQELGSGDQAGHLLRHRPGGRLGHRPVRAALHGALGASGLYRWRRSAHGGGGDGPHGDGCDTLDQHPRGDPLPALGIHEDHHAGDHRLVPGAAQPAAQVQAHHHQPGADPDPLRSHLETT